MAFLMLSGHNFHASQNDTLLCSKQHGSELTFSGIKLGTELYQIFRQTLKKFLGESKLFQTLQWHFGFSCVFDINPRLHIKKNYTITHMFLPHFHPD